MRHGTAPFAVAALGARLPPRRASNYSGPARPKYGIQQVLRDQRILCMKSSFSIILTCLLMAAAPGVAADPGRARASALARDSRDRVVCRRFLRTGSLVDSYRTCKTNAEWRREHENLPPLRGSESSRAPP